MRIRNFVKIDDRLATSGQPESEAFQEIAELGYQCIINLAMPDSDHAISNESELVTQLGMSYVHIPVIWESPKIEQFYFFSDVLNALREQKVWIHCALNMRVSSFIFMYKVLYESEDYVIARARLEKIWKPNSLWQSYIDEGMALPIPAQL